jgi:nicotinate-nucleotide--dimethylbenzimidazole phosphoribosyltransferase
MNVLSGGSAINQIAQQAGAEIVLVDVGVAGDLSLSPTHPVLPLRDKKVRAGTANLRVAPAMSLDEAALALSVGEEIAAEAIQAGADVIGLGEIGIGNTTAAAALTHVFTGIPASELVGAGTGVAGEARLRKRQVVEDAIRRHAPSATDPLSALASVGGLEIAALVGCTLEAARRRIPVVLDGVVTSAAALVAVALEPRAREYLVASHLSPEPAARVALDRLRLHPLLELEMRLGEGTGAALGFGILQTAVTTVQSMATFATAGVVGRAGLRAEEDEEPGV